MIKVGIIGCGKIADQHADTIQRVRDAALVGVCDTEELMAQQMYERFKVRHYFSDTRRLLDAVSPGIIHITTPPQSHFELAMLCLDAGCSVYVEKPFTLTADEAEKLVEHATEKKLKITVGHNAQFTPAARRMRELIKTGYLGGPPLHLESYYFYNLDDARFAKALLGDKDHWVRKLPGKLLHNIICHGISKIAEFWPSDTCRVATNAFTSRLLKSIHEHDIIDELRVIISDNDCTTAYFTFSSQMKPTLHQLRVCGPKNSLCVDDDHQTLIKMEGAKYKSHLDQFMPPLIDAQQYFSNSMRNIRSFITRQASPNPGMKYLMESFYSSVEHDTPLPLSYREILLTSKIVDTVFSQIYA